MTVNVVRARAFSLSASRQVAPRRSHAMRRASCCLMASLTGARAAAKARASRSTDRADRRVVRPGHGYPRRAGHHPRAAAVQAVRARAGAATGVKPGTYAFRKRHLVVAASWTTWKAGRVLTARVVVPEAWDLRGIAPRIAAAGLEEDSVLAS
jgi:hypothetical protein